MQRKTEVWVFAIFAVVIIGGVIVAGIFSSSGAPSSPNFVATTAAPLSATDHTRGDATSTVTVTEYGDFECPACGAYEPLVEQLTNEFGTRVLFVFRNFPLYQIHPFAMIAAQAAEAAALQGQYWQMHDLLYKDQAQWTANTALAPADVVTKFFDGYAQQLGMSVTKFDSDINSDVVKSKVQQDLASGNAAQVNHTPTFFINFTQIPNPGSLQEFETDINDALAGQPIPGTTSATGTSTSAQ